MPIQFFMQPICSFMQSDSQTIFMVWMLWCVECIDFLSSTNLIMRCYRSLVFHDFVAKCLTKDPRLRPTAAEMLKVAIILGCWLSIPL